MSWLHIETETVRKPAGSALIRLLRSLPSVKPISVSEVVLGLVTGRGLRLARRIEVPDPASAHAHQYGAGALGSDPAAVPTANV